MQELARDDVSTGEEKKRKRNMKATEDEGSTKKKAKGGKGEGSKGEGAKKKGEGAKKKAKGEEAGTGTRSQKRRREDPTVGEVISGSVKRGVNTVFVRGRKT